MKLGGITWWRNNYGSILQALALQTYLRCELNQDYIIINQYSKKIVSFANLADKLKNDGFKITVRKIIGRMGFPQLRRISVLQAYVDKYLITTAEVFSADNIIETNQLFDGFICGSDQIWNPANTNLDSIYWLKFVQKDKVKIAYAPSIGIDRAEEDIVKSIRENLSSFDAVSSREESGTRFINSIQDKVQCQTVLDPTFLLERSFWDDLSEKRLFDKKYIFAYILRGDKEERKRIESFAKRINLAIVTIPFLDGEYLVQYDLVFGDKKLWDASPSDFISAIRYAEYVFTDSFHCMVFSCLYHRKFFLFPKKGNLQMSRIEGLQKLLGTGDRILAAHLSTEQLIAYDGINWDRVDKNVEEKRIESQEFLKSAIERGNRKCLL